jgi:hypothetical protein
MADIKDPRKTLAPARPRRAEVDWSTDWQPISDAVRATVFAWGEDRLGITYEFADWRRQAQTIGDDDWLVMTRLERYGALTYRDDNAKRLADKLRAARLTERRSPANARRRRALGSHAGQATTTLVHSTGKIASFRKSRGQDMAIWLAGLRKNGPTFLGSFDRRC